MNNKIKLLIAVSVFLIGIITFFYGLVHEFILIYFMGASLCLPSSLLAVKYIKILFFRYTVINDCLYHRCIWDKEIPEGYLECNGQTVNASINQSTGNYFYRMSVFDLGIYKSFELSEEQKIKLGKNGEVVIDNGIYKNSFLTDAENYNFSILKQIGKIEEKNGVKIRIDC